ncbi:MipA/OmpV family protein [Litorimonas sp. RW-G-Af-16]|uniref:MipA/OmpV family protein n=1 Tax=Litorimonas sp. RW-G-Af-16 TaxID=3241168 RepID=UPI00390CAD2E
MRLAGLAPFALACLWPVSVAAQERPPNSFERPDPNGWNVSVGGGALLSPNYLGDDDYALSLVPSIRVTKGDRAFASVEGGIGYAVIATDNFRAGPLAQVEFGRDEDGGGPFRASGDRTTDLIGLGDIDTSISLGGYAEFDFGKITASAKLGQAISGHDGLTGELGLRYKGRVQGNGPPIIYSFGPSLNFGDATYTNAFFGVTETQSAASGLGVYEASGGVTSYGVSTNVIVPMTRTVTGNIIAQYNRLTGDVADAPLVQQRGSVDQVFLGVIASYRFN